MIKITKVDTYNWEAAIRGMRNPMNSWDKTDSRNITSILKPEFIIGDADLKLASKLAKLGGPHAKFKRMIGVSMDINAPLYWWKEFDTYKVGTVADSCSTMHTIHKKEFTIDDFSHEQLGVYTFAINENGEDEPCVQNLWIESLKRTINDLNIAREFYNNEKNPGLKKSYWWQMIQLLPSSYNQKRTVSTNYEVLSNIHYQRYDHKLDEWREFCEVIRDLPYAKELIICE